MEQEEAVRTAVGMFRVERADGVGGGGKNLVVERQRFGLRVLEVAQDREVDVRIEVAERLHLDVRRRDPAPGRRCRESSG